MTYNLRYLLRQKAHRNRPAPQALKGYPPAFTLVEVLIVLAIIGILIAILSSALLQAKASSQTATCANNLRHVGIAFQRYQHAFGGKVPDASTVLDATEKGLGAYLDVSRDQRSAAYICPTVLSQVTSVGNNQFNNSYGVNPCVGRLLAESAKVVALDANADLVDYEGTNKELWQSDVDPRHFGSMNVLFCDGHVDRHLSDELNPYAEGTVQQLPVVLAYWKPELSGCDCRTSGFGRGQGLLGEYYTTDQWAGTPEASRLDPTLELPFGNPDFYGVPYDVPLPGATTSRSAPLKTAKFRGSILGLTNEPYQFHVCCDNEVWVYVNGSLVISRSAGGAGGVQQWQAGTTTVDLSNNRWIDFEVRWREEGVGSPSHLMVRWSCPSSPAPTKIPSSQLRPARQ